MKPVTAYIDHPNCDKCFEFLGAHEFETFRIDRDASFKKDVRGKYNFEYFFVTCIRENNLQWVSLDQLKKVFGKDSIQSVAEFLLGSEFTIRTRIVKPEGHTGDVKYFEVIEFNRI
jgi:hypothetical protein